MTSRRKRRGEGSERRGEILAAARRVFAAEGTARTSMRRIAAEVGLSPTAIYLYFRDKAALLAALGDEAFAELEAGFAALAVGPDPRERLAGTIRAYVAFGLARPDLYRLIFMTGAGLEHGHHRSDAAPRLGPAGRGAAAFGFLHGQIAALMDAGRIPPGDPVALAECAWAAGHGLVALLITHPEFPWTERARLTEALVGMVLRGLGMPEQ